MLRWGLDLFKRCLMMCASCGRFLSSSSGDDKRLLVVQPIIIEEVLLLDRANQQKFICPPPRATTDRWVTTEDPRPQALTSGSRGSEGWAEQGQGIYILLIGIRTLFDGVTRGYGDHSPLMMIRVWCEARQGQQVEVVETCLVLTFCINSTRAWRLLFVLVLTFCINSTRAY